MSTLTIEHHAVLFALLSKHAIQLCEKKGEEAILKAMTRYGNERGARMAQNALKNGEELTVLNSQAYGEWKPDYPGQMEFGIIHGEPTLNTYISKCAWCEAWKKHGLMEYGKFYCVNVDNAWFQGFNPEFLCKTITPAMSWGGHRCEFDWGEALSPAQLDELANKKKELGSSCMRDFNFHTAHLLSSIGDTLVKELGADGEKAVELAKAEFDKMFGKEYLESINGLY